MLNWFDIIIAIALITAFASGFRQGLIRQLINLCGLILGVVFAGQTAKIILPWLLQITHIPHNIASVVSYLMAFAIIMAIIALLGSIIQKFIAIIHLGFFNKLLGSIHRNSHRSTQFDSQCGINARSERKNHKKRDKRRFFFFRTHTNRYSCHCAIP